MANKIILKKSSVATKVPVAGDLEIGEIAVNLVDQKLYSKNANGTVVLVGQGAGGSGSVTSVAVSGGTTGLTTSGGPITASGTITLGGTLAIASGGTGQTTAATAITALTGTQTSGQYLRSDGTNAALAAIVANDVPTLNQNTTGSAATLTTGRTISITGDLAYTSASFDGSAAVTGVGTLATVNSNVGSFTNASVTVNAKGLVTAVSSGAGGSGVTSVTGTSPVASSGGTTPAISLAAAYGDTLNPYASKTANFFLAAPSGAAGVPTFRAIVASDIPTLNQNTTGTSASATGSAATFTSTSQNSQFNSIGVGTAASATAGEIRATNNITAYFSDDRFKTNLGNITEPLAKIMRLNGFYYEPNALAQSYGYEKKLEVGVSAQQVLAVQPEVVAPAPIDENYLTVRYERLVPLLIEAIKELNEKVMRLEQSAPYFNKGI
jgi:hypothetical protein